jgi:beta-phosphoglucomutase
MKIEVIIWDLDGVLIDSESMHIQAERETLKEFGIDLTLSVAKKYFGIKLRDYFSDILARYKSPVSLDKLMQHHYATLLRYYRDKFPLTPGALDVLYALQERYRMAVATSREKQLADIALERFSLFQFFETIVYGEDTIYGKPHPEPFLTVCKRLHTKPHLSIVIEDASSGIQAAKTAGMTGIVRIAAHNADIDFSDADYRVYNLKEIPSLLLKIIRVNTHTASLRSPVLRIFFTGSK